MREQASLLVDRGVMSVIGITLLTATAGFGLYVYAAPILSGSAKSMASALSLWSIGGLIGSLLVGYVVDLIGKLRWVMAAILATLMLMYLVIPAFSLIPGLGLVPFLIWGAMGWSTMTPQQCILNQLKPGRDSTLAALNSSAVSLGAVAGAAFGGLALEIGLNAKSLPYAATGLVFCAFAWQVKLIQRQRNQRSIKFELKLP